MFVINRLRALYERHALQGYVYVMIGLLTESSIRHLPANKPLVRRSTACGQRRSPPLLSLQLLFSDS